MPRSTLLQNQFTRGELSPRMKGRVDLDQYFQGAQTQVNFLSLPHGGATGRPGSVYVDEVRSSSSSQRLLDFIFSTSDAYVLEFCNQTISFFRNRGQIVSADTDASITNGTFDSGITGWTDQSTGVATIAHDASNLTLQLNGNGSDIAIAEQAPTTTSTGTEHVLRFDVIGASTSGLVKVRIGSTSGGVDYLAETSFKNGYHCIAFTPAASPFYIQFRNEENAAHDIDNVSLIDNAPIEISSPYADGDLFPIQYVQDADRMFLVHPSYKPMELTRSGHSSWSLTSYTPTADVFTSADNYPAAVALFEQRLVFGFTNTNPQTLYFSKSADIQDMTTGTGASDGFTKTLFASQANPIRWVVGGSDLIIGTTGGEWVVDRPASSAVTVSNFSVKRRETSGVANLAPAEVDNRVLFMARRGAATNNGEDLLEFRFDDDEAEFVAPDLTLVSEHITDGGIVEMAWQQRGWKGSYQSIDLPSTKRILWLVRSDGVLLSFTYNFHELVAAWARHTWDGTVESACVIPGSQGDEVWIVVQRTINSVTKRYVEYLDPDYFVDSGITGTSGSPTTAWSGLDHLEGKEVTILADGAPVDSKTVVSGAITLDATASTIQVGLVFTPEIELMPLEIALPDGSSIGAAKSVSRVIVRLLSTVGIKVTASSRTSGDEVIFREVSDSVQSPIPPFTGDKIFTPPASWIDATVKITQNNPLPVTIQAVAMEVEAHR